MTALRFITFGAIVCLPPDISQGLVRNTIRSSLLTARVLLPVTRTPPRASDFRLTIHMKHHFDLALLVKLIRFHLPSLLNRVAESIPVILSTASETMTSFVPWIRRRDMFHLPAQLGTESLLPDQRGE